MLWNGDLLTVRLFRIQTYMHACMIEDSQCIQQMWRLKFWPYQHPLLHLCVYSRDWVIFKSGFGPPTWVLRGYEATRLALTHITPMICLTAYLLQAVFLDPFQKSITKFVATELIRHLLLNISRPNFKMMYAKHFHALGTRLLVIPKVRKESHMCIRGCARCSLRLANPTYSMAMPVTALFPYRHDRSQGKHVCALFWSIILLLFSTVSLAPYLPAHLVWGPARALLGVLKWSYMTLTAALGSFPYTH